MYVQTASHVRTVDIRGPLMLSSAASDVGGAPELGRPMYEQTASNVRMIVPTASNVTC